MSFENCITPSFKHQKFTLAVKIFARKISEGVRPHQLFLLKQVHKSTIDKKNQNLVCEIFPVPNRWRSCANFPLEYEKLFATL